VRTWLTLTASSPSDRVHPRTVLPRAHGPQRPAAILLDRMTTGYSARVDEGGRMYSISVRLQRTTTEEAYLSVPVDESIMQDGPVADGSYRIDPDKLWAEAIRLAGESGHWTIEDRQVTPHPIQQAPPWVAEVLREQPPSR
jgi:hypothetical protein